MLQHPLDPATKLFEDAEALADRNKTNNALAKIAAGLWHLTQAIDHIQSNQDTISRQLVSLGNQPRTTFKGPRL